MDDEKPSARLRFGFLLVDLLMLVLAWRRRFRDDDSALGRVAEFLLGGLVIGIGLLQRARRAWRASWWALAGWVNLRWRCQLCQQRRRRGSSAFCVRCCDAGLGYADYDDGDEVSL